MIGKNKEDIESVSDVSRARSSVLIFSAFISGLCSIIYELLIATTASYFLGDGVKFFSLTIGIYMAAMGAGTYVSKYIDKDILVRFVQTELVLAVLGGISVPILYMSYAFSEHFILAYGFFTVAIGFLIGLEIPFLTRLMERYYELKFNIANILSLDYLGALIATIAFPFILLPVFGTYQSSLIFGLVNMTIAFGILWIFQKDVGPLFRLLRFSACLLSVLLVAMIILSGSMLKYWEQGLYQDRIVFSEQSKYQKIVLTKDKSDIRLYLDGNLQFSSIDEYRYHEALVHVPLSLSHKPVEKVLLLGAGDGLAVRELLKYATIKKIVLVDLDQKMIDLGRNNYYLRELNQDSLRDPKVEIIIADALSFIKNTDEKFDFIIQDLPDPNNNELARLYSRQFFAALKNVLSPGGLFVTQATSPYFAPQAFWSIANTIKASGLPHIYPYRANVPSFGEWGFVLASEARLNMAAPKLRAETRYLDEKNIRSLFSFEKDTVAKDAPVNTLDKPVLLQLYLQGWEYYR